jgi:hypothetical protein
MGPSPLASGGRDLSVRCTGWNRRKPFCRP